ncbi:MAG: hypothetical protein ACRDGA_03135, partial [Bacteroidota bacterium]
MDPKIFNAARWDGITWNLFRVTVIFRGSMITPPLEGAFAFSPTDIWFVGSLPVHGDGMSWTMFDVRSLPGMQDVSLSKGWGVNSSRMYFAGRGGSLVFYNGSTWQRLASGTNTDIQDIWGVRESSKEHPTVLCAVSNVIEAGERKILKVTDQLVVDTVQWSTGRRVHSLWFENESLLYASGGGVFIRNEQRVWR